MRLGRRELRQPGGCRTRSPGPRSESGLEQQRPTAVLPSSADDRPDQRKLVRISIQLRSEAGDNPMQIAVHLTGGEVVEFRADPDEWYVAFSKSLRKRRGVEIADHDH